MQLNIVNYVNFDCLTGELDHKETKVFMSLGEAIKYIAEDFASIKDEIVQQDGDTRNCMELNLDDTSAEIVYGDTESEERHRMHKWWLA